MGTIMDWMLLECLIDWLQDVSVSQIGPGSGRFKFDYLVYNHALY